ncbi:MAG: bifunctional GTP cyclohydrolase [Monoraphidium minutum]|nr:MAG: bifunctional GTP cyclohydrolase [Monoraphidium minutum]
MDAPSSGFDSIASALEDLAAGKFVVVLDDEDRENEGDLIIAGDKVTTEAMAFMVEYTSGVICIAMPGADLDRLRLPLMVDSRENNESMYTAFTVTVDLKDGTSTGISAADRAATIRAMADPAAAAADFRRPGHIFPLRYRDGGVLVRPGHTEAAVDLSRLAGSYPAGVLCEIVDKADGSMQRTPQLLAFSKAHGLKCITIADLIRYRLRHEQLLECVATAPLSTRHGEFTAHVFRSAVDGAEHAALVCGGGGGGGAAAGQQQRGVLTAVHAQSALVDVFGSLHCGREGFLDQSLAALAAEGAGVLLYIHAHQEQSGGGGAAGGGDGMAAELLAHAAAQRECAVDGGGGGGGGEGALGDLRDDAVAAQMLRHLGVPRVRLLGGGEADAARLRAFGLDTAAAGGGGGGGSGVNGAGPLHGLRSPAAV